MNDSGMAGRNQRATGRKDNYLEFLGRLEKARATLERRKESVIQTQKIAASLLEQNAHGLRLWEARLDKTKHFRRAEQPHPRSLGELHDAATRMESMFRNRTRCAGERVAAIKARRAEIEAALQELLESKEKLDASRQLSQERENLRRAIADLGGTPRGSTPGIADLGLQDDLTDARRAVILAEALLELKGE